MALDDTVLEIGIPGPVPAKQRKLALGARYGPVNVTTVVRSNGGPASVGSSDRDAAEIVCRHLRGDLRVHCLQESVVRPDHDAGVGVRSVRIALVIVVPGKLSVKGDIVE